MLLAAKIQNHNRSQDREDGLLDISPMESGTPKSTTCSSIPNSTRSLSNSAATLSPAAADMLTAH